MYMKHLGLLAIVALVGCAADHTAQLPPAPFSPGPSSAPYRVSVGDLLAVKVYLVPELSEEIAVRPDGRISTSLAQGITAAGHTPEEIARDLRIAYAPELRDPVISVIVERAAPIRVVVAGEVVSPGEIASDGVAPSLVQASARAGGLKPTGDPARVIILRRGGDDKPVLYAADYDGAAQGTHPLADVRLAPFDVVMVPKTDVAKIYVWVNQHIQQFVPVSWGFSYSVNPANNYTSEYKK